MPTFIVSKIRNMKKLLFSGLIFCGLLLTAAQTSAQSIFAYTENNKVVIRWTASNEQLIDRYVVERSTDSSYFTPLHEVVSKGPITTEEENRYEDADTRPAPVNFYRIRTDLKDGGALYTATVRVDTDPGDQPTLKPNAVHLGGTLFVTNNRSNRPITINFFDAYGTLIGSYLVNGNAFNISTDRLKQGVVFYRISDQTRPLINAGKLVIL